MKIKLINKSNNPTPKHETNLSAGVDLRAEVGLPIVLFPGDICLVPTGLFIQLPEGTEAQIRPRSGLAFKHGITVLNSPGTIDADYTGEIKVLLINHGKGAFTINQGERIAQMVVVKHEFVDFEEVDRLSDTERGSGGFGSTGTK